MNYVRTALMATLTIVLLAGLSVAEEPAAENQSMPELGPPPEIQEAASIVGTWKYEGEMLMQPGDTVWVHHEASVVFSLVCGGAAIQMEYIGDVMAGQEMRGLSLTTYDRELEQWQEVWTDNYMARMSMYTGQIVDGKRIMTGKDRMDGQVYDTKITSYDISEDSFKWKMENSMDGENWYVSMKGTYTRVK